MKKKTVLLIGLCVLLVLAALCILCANRYVCQIPADDVRIEPLPDSIAFTPFIDDAHRDRLIARTVRRHLPSFREPVTVTITDWAPGLYNGKEALCYTLKIRDAEGFSALCIAHIYPRW